MIIGIRSIVFCDRVEQTTAGKVNLYGLWGDTLGVTTKPGFLDINLALLFELDRRATRGHIRFAASELEWFQPIDLAAGQTLAAAAPGLIIPILRPGNLMISIHDHDAPKAKPFRFKYALEFDPNAHVLDDQAVAETTAAARQFAVDSAAGFERWRNSARLH